VDYYELFKGISAALLSEKKESTHFMEMGRKAEALNRASLLANIYLSPKCQYLMIRANERGNSKRRMPRCQCGSILSMLPNSNSTTLLNEQVNSVPFLLGLIEDLGIGSLIDAHVRPHGHWQGASVGTLVTIWLAHILSERSHRLVAVRDWAAARSHTIQTLLGFDLRATDCTDDRLANVLSMLGSPSTQAILDSALTHRWIRLYRLPSDTIRLDSTSVSVYHDFDPAEQSSLLQRGHSKDNRPDLAQFKVMLATLDPLGLPLCCQIVPGNRADDPLYIPAYEAAVAAVGTRDVLVVGDCKMAALETRGHITAHNSRYLCRLYAPWAAREVAGWVEKALEHRDSWELLEEVDARTGEIRLVAQVHTHQREQSWIDPVRGQRVEWTERVLLVRSQAYWHKVRAKQEKALDKLVRELTKLGEVAIAGRGRRHYSSRTELEGEITKRIAAAGLEGEGVVRIPVAEVKTVAGRCCWVVEQVRVERAAWEAHLERLGWQVCLTSATAEQCSTRQVLETYHGQVVHERDFARLKSRAVHIRPVYVGDEQRIAGLVWLLMLALRVLVITEQRLRAELARRGESLGGLNPASRTQRTLRPTTERVLDALAEITLTRWHDKGGRWRGHITPLNGTQQHILDLLGLPPDLYDRLAHAPPNFAVGLRE
jgi:transposase